MLFSQVDIFRGWAFQLCLFGLEVAFFVRKFTPWIFFVPWSGGQIGGYDAGGLGSKSSGTAPLPGGPGHFCFKWDEWGFTTI
jgi:hypothetical protein